MSYLVSTKGRYALRVMLELSRHPDTLVPLKEIADGQQISLKYMETIMPLLKEAGFVEGTHGEGGGYKLSRPADSYTVGEVLRVTEGTISPVACLDNGFICERAAECPTLPIWRNLDTLIKGYLDTVKLTDLVVKDSSDNYVI